MNYHHQKGIRVSNAPRSAKSPAAKTGLFAPLASLLSAKGTGAPSSPADPSSVAVRSSATDPAGQVRAPRAKGKHGKDAGRVNGSAIGSTEDAARRRLAAAKGGRGALDRERASATKGTQVTNTTRSARTPFLRTGIFAALRGVFGGGGGRTSSLRPSPSPDLGTAGICADPPHTHISAEPTNFAPPIRIANCSAPTATPPAAQPRSAYRSTAPAPDRSPCVEAQMRPGPAARATSRASTRRPRDSRSLAGGAPARAASRRGDEAQMLDAGRGLPARQLLVGGQHRAQRVEDVLASLLASAALAQRPGHLEHPGDDPALLVGLLESDRELDGRGHVQRVAAIPSGFAIDAHTSLSAQPAILAPPTSTSPASQGGGGEVTTSSDQVSSTAVVAIDAVSLASATAEACHEDQSLADRRAAR
jgi:hypothetical protein